MKTLFANSWPDIKRLIARLSTPSKHRIVDADPPRLVYGVTVGKSAKTLLRGQLSHFQQEGWDVTLIASPDDDSRATACREGVSFHPIPMAREISPALDVVSLIQWVLAVRNIRPRVINVGTPKAALLGTLAGWLLRVPTRVYVIRGLRSEGASSPKRQLLLFAEAATIALATDVIAVSPSLLEVVRSYGIDPKHKAIVIGHGSSNGVDVPRLEREAAGSRGASVRQEIGLPDSAFVVGFVGRINPDKGIEVLLKAAHALRGVADTEFVIVGQRESGGSLSPYENLPNVHWLPWVSNPARIMTAFDVLLLPTRREGFPNVVLEAAALRIPAITTRATGAIDSVVHGETGLLVEIDDEVGIVQALEFLREHPRAVGEMGSKARARAIQDYSLEPIWRELESIYRR